MWLLHSGVVTIVHIVPKFGMCVHVCAYLCVFHSGLLLSLLLLSVLANASYGSPPPSVPPGTHTFSLPVRPARFLLLGGAAGRYCTDV